jgi:hypothetical protein
MDHVQIYKHYAEKNIKQKHFEKNRFVDSVVNSVNFDIVVAEMYRKECFRPSVVDFFKSVDIEHVLVGKELYEFLIEEDALKRDGLFGKAEKAGISFGIYLDNSQNSPFFYIFKNDNIIPNQCFLMVNKNKSRDKCTAYHSLYKDRLGIEFCWSSSKSVRAILEAQEKLRTN